MTWIFATSCRFHRLNLEVLQDVDILPVSLLCAGVKFPRLILAVSMLELQFFAYVCKVYICIIYSVFDIIAFSGYSAQKGEKVLWLPATWDYHRCWWWVIFRFLFLCEFHAFWTNCRSRVTFRGFSFTDVALASISLTRELIVFTLIALHLLRP